MSYNLKTDENNEVTIIKKVGSAYVKTTFPVGKCKGIIESSKDVKSSDRWEGFGIVANDEIYFEGSFVEDSPAEIKKQDDPKPERKNFGKSDKKYFGKKKH